MLFLHVSIVSLYTAKKYLLPILSDRILKRFKGQDLIIYTASSRAFLCELAFFATVIGQQWEMLAPLGAFALLCAQEPRASPLSPLRQQCKCQPSRKDRQHLSVAVTVVLTCGSHNMCKSHAENHWSSLARKIGWLVLGLLLIFFFQSVFFSCF